VSWLKVNGTCPVCRYSLATSDEQSDPTGADPDIPPLEDDDDSYPPPSADDLQMEDVD
jgi:hypothetical protein